MRHFNNFSVETQEEIFHMKPVEFTNDSPKSLLAATLGASLYCPSTRKSLSSDVVKNARAGSTSMIMCLEDSIADSEVPQGEANIKCELPLIAQLPPLEVPSLFIRVRNPEHLVHVAMDNFDHLDVLTGFVLPKFNGLTNGKRYLSAMEMVNRKLRSQGRREKYFMPVLESEELVFRESRELFLSSTKSLLDSSRGKVLAVRIGATDMSSAYGLRRSRDLAIYDVQVIASAIGDIVNMFGRFEDGFQVTGAVWEHFTDRERLFKPALRTSIFNESEAKRMRAELVLRDLDGLIREIELDRVNGLLGKTVIHPLHVSLVNAMSVVSFEEFSDAEVLLNGSGEDTGAVASSYRNKMNEQKPHYPWAVKTLNRAYAFGVAKPEVSVSEIMRAGISEYV